jgi:hypothetical protein
MRNCGKCIFEIDYHFKNRKNNHTYNEEIAVREAFKDDENLMKMY